jgi:hypothetical protein
MRELQLLHKKKKKKKERGLTPTEDGGERQRDKIDPCSLYTLIAWEKSCDTKKENIPKKDNDEIPK